MTGRDLTGADRCWPCTIANSSVGLLVAWLPLVAASGTGNTAVIAGSIAWGVAATVFTGYRLIMEGFLPMAEPVAKLTGLHDRIGPASGSEDRRDAE